MSLARKCDKCGAFYDNKDVKPDLMLRKYKHGYGEEVIDLCPDCQRILEEWVEEPDKSYILLNKHAKKLLLDEITAACFEVKSIKNDINFRYGTANVIYVEKVFEILKKFDLVPEVKNDKT